MPPIAVCRCRNQHLTDRHVDLVALVAGGLSDRQIATRLGVTVPTVRHHLQSAMQRATACSRTELVALCFASGVLATGCWPPRATENRCLGRGTFDAAAV